MVFLKKKFRIGIWNLRPPPSVIEKNHPKFPFWLIATFSRWKSENKQRGHNRKHVVLSPGLQSYLSGCRACHTPPQWLWSCSFNRPKVTSKQKTNMTSINHTTTPPPQWLWSCSFNRPKLTSKQETNMTSINCQNLTLKQPNLSWPLGWRNKT